VGSLDEIPHDRPVYAWGVLAVRLTPRIRLQTVEGRPLIRLLMWYLIDTGWKQEGMEPR